MKVAVICAVDRNGRNPGMASVEAAATHLFESLEGVDPTYFVPAGGNSMRYPSREQKEWLNLVDNERYWADFDRIIFWGDFLCSKTYIEEEMIRRLALWDIAHDSDSARDLLYKVLLLEDAPSRILRNVILFGVSTLPDQADSLSHYRYRNALTRLLEYSMAVLPRDPITMAKLLNLTPAANIQLGCDPVLIYPKRHKSSIKDTHQAIPARKNVACYFGRISRYEAFAFSLLVLYLRYFANVRITWIEWLKARPREKVIARFCDRASFSSDDILESRLLEIEKSHFVLSNIYHMCLNSLANGTPCIGFGHGSQVESRTIGSKKKELFFSTLYSDKYYFFVEQLVGHRVISAMREIKRILYSNPDNASVSLLAQIGKTNRERLEWLFTS